jgi:hypothetical protein
VQESRGPRWKRKENRGQRVGITRPPFETEREQGAARRITRPPFEMERKRGATWCGIHAAPVRKERKQGATCMHAAPIRNERKEGADVWHSCRPRLYPHNFPPPFYASRLPFPLLTPPHSPPVEFGAYIPRGGERQPE